MESLRVYGAFCILDPATIRAFFFCTLRRAPARHGYVYSCYSGLLGIRVMTVKAGPMGGAGVILRRRGVLFYERGGGISSVEDLFAGAAV